MESVNDILVVEDEALIAMDIGMTLETAGLAPVRVLPTLRSAMDYLRIKVPRAALLDVNLGNGDTSVQVALRLLELGRPFIFLTGYTSATFTFPAELEGVERMSKPFDEITLVSVIRRHLSD